MTTERILHDAAILHNQWQEAAHTAITNQQELHDVAEQYGTELMSQVVQRQLTVAHLRAGVAWVNALDHEATKLTSGDFETLGKADYLEAVARRIAHQAGRLALSNVKNERQLHTTIVRFGRIF